MSSASRPALWLVVSATIVTGIAWGVVIPPFEGLDERYYYQAALASANGTDAGHPLFFALTTPLLRMTGARGVPFRIHMNPAYRPGFNRRGEVNFYLHDRTHNASGFHIRRLYLLRGAVLALWLLTMIAAYETARLLLHDDELALLATGLCIFLPQASYFLAKVHTDVLATLLSTLAYLALVARAFGKITRGQSLLASAVLLALVPWSDRQAYPLFLTVPIALILLERSWKQRMIAAALAVVPFVALAWRMSTKYVGGDLSAWLGPLVYYRGPWWSIDTGNYLLFEALPKTIFGFVGWFNSSLLLPPWMYAFVVDLGILGLVGLGLVGIWHVGPVVRKGITDSELASLILAIAVFDMVMPVVYTNIVIVRNPDGRYLFSALVPMALLCLLGLLGLARSVRTWPRLPALVLAAVVIAGVVIWQTGGPAWVTAGVKAYHYGNQPHLLATIRDITVGFVLAPLLFAIVRTAPPLWFQSVPAWFSWFVDAMTPRRVFVTAWILNLLLLLVFVRPMYQPLTAAELAEAIHEFADSQDFARAAAVTQVAIDEFPDSEPLRQIASTGGIPPGAHPDLKVLARTIRTKGWPRLERLLSLLDREGSAEGAELLRMQLQPELKTDPAVAARLLQRPWVLSMELEVNRQASILGLDVHDDPRGGCELTVFFRPKGPWSGNHLWVHAYPIESHDYDNLLIDPPEFSGWDPGELAWEVFHSAQRSAVLFAGVQVAGNSGPATLLAQMSNCLASR